MTPSKIVAIGLNYKDHAAEMNKPLPAEPLMFMKPSTAVIGPGESIRIPPNVGEVHYEAELGVVIGKRASRVPADKAMEHVLGLTCLIDVTARELQRKEIQYTRAKGFDTFAPIGPCIAIGLDPSALDVEGLAERRAKAGVEHAAADFHGAADRRVRLERHDAASRRRHRHGNAVRRGPAEERRYVYGEDSGHRRADQYGR